MINRLCSTPDFNEDDFNNEDFYTTPWGFAVTFKTWLWQRLPVYFIKNDTYKDANNQGLLERFMSVFGSEIDREIIPKIECYLNIIDAQQCETKFLTPLSDSLGNPPDIFQDTEIYRNLLSFVVSVYKIKGTIASYELFFSILGYDIIITEADPPGITSIYDNPVEYDSGNFYDDDNCNPCSNYSILFSDATDGEIQVTQETLEKLRSAIYFTEPINANLTSLTAKLEVSDDMTIDITDEAVEETYTTDLYDDGLDYDSGNNYDEGAGQVLSPGELFIVNAGITDQGQQDAVMQLVTDLEDAFIWDSMIAIYPYVGGTELAHKFNLKDAQDEDTSFRLNFGVDVGAWTHSANGSKPTNATTSKADTFFIPEDNWVDDGNVGMTNAFYDTNAENGSAIGCQNAGGTRKAEIIHRNDLFGGRFFDIAGRFKNPGSNDARGPSTTVRVGGSPSAITIHRRGVKIDTGTPGTTDIAGTDTPVYVNMNGNVGGVKTFCFNAIHGTLTDLQVVDLHAAIDDFSTALSRKTW